MASWQLQEAKQRLSEVLRKTATEGPQTVTKHGEAVAVIIDIAEYRRLTGDDLKTFLRSGSHADLDVDRDPSPVRDIELQ